MVGRGDVRRLDRLLAAAKAGERAVLVLRGAAGTGKTALLEYVANGAEGSASSEPPGSKPRWSFRSRVFISCAPHCWTASSGLPRPQADALGTAFGLSAGAPARSLSHRTRRRSRCCPRLPRSCRFCVWSTTRNGLTSPRPRCWRSWRGASRPRRSSLLFAVREAPEVDELAGLPNLRLARLTDDGRARAAGSVIGAPLDERVRARILAEARATRSRCSSCHASFRP